MPARHFARQQAMQSAPLRAESLLAGFFQMESRMRKYLHVDDLGNRTD
jgi:hypothetical protein